MKHRWLASLLLGLALTLGACQPAEGGEGAGESTPAPVDYYDGY